jgi:TolA-binding protein
MRIQSTISLLILGAVVCLLLPGVGCRALAGGKLAEEVAELRASLAAQEEAVEALKAELKELREALEALGESQKLLARRVDVLQGKLSSLPAAEAAEPGAGLPGERGGDPLVKDPGALYAEGRRLLEEGRHNHAVMVFEELIALYPGDPRAEDAAIAIGESYLARGDYRRAAEQFEAFARDHAGSARLQAALLGAGRAYEALEMPSQAKRVYEALVDRYPGSSEAKVAADRLDAIERATDENGEH